jgi:hypothetical protein
MYPMRRRFIGELLDPILEIPTHPDVVPMDASDFSVVLLKPEAIWVKHRPSGHQFEFKIEGPEKLSAPHYVTPELTSIVDASELSGPARQAVLAFLRKLLTSKNRFRRLRGG